MFCGAATDVRTTTMAKVFPRPSPRPPQFLIEIPSVVEDRKITAAARAESDALALTAVLF